MGFVWAIGCVAGSLIIWLVAIHVYFAHEARLAGELLQDLQSVAIGESEDSALSMTLKHDGHRWVNMYKADYDDSDYEYVFEVNPWRYRTIPGRTRKLDQPIRSLANRVPPRWRQALDLRASGRPMFQRPHVARRAASYFSRADFDGFKRFRVRGIIRA